MTPVIKKGLDPWQQPPHQLFPPTYKEGAHVEKLKRYIGHQVD